MSNQKKYCGRKKMDEMERKEAIQTYFQKKDIEKRGGKEKVKAVFESIFNDLGYFE